jgi:Holliday junction DNA helicase RuvA
VLHQLRNGALLVDVQGVGYEVHVASSEPAPFDELVELFIFTVVREDAIQLFGFRTIEDREFFEMLLVTPGVGPSTALGALRTMSVAELALAIESDDAKKIATISGIGPKTASRIVLELKGKVTLEGAFAPAKASTHYAPLATPATKYAMHSMTWSCLLMSRPRCAQPSNSCGDRDQARARP